MNYLSTSERSEFILKEKGSKFIAVAIPCSSTENFKENLKLIQEEFPKATHYCYAYRFFGPPVTTRANDDGEPSNSAGAPILGQIQSFDLFDIAIIVIRYYGGKKLGVSGLIQAYKNSAKIALENSQIIEKETSLTYSITGDYLSVSYLLSEIKKLKTRVLEQNLNETSQLTIEVPHSENEQILSTLETLKIKVKQI